MADVLAEIAAAARGRVAVDGVTAAGKTTFADALARIVAGSTRTSLDDFHRPPPHEYYPDSFDFERFRAHVLALEGTVIADGVFLLHPGLRDLWDVTVFLTVDRAVALERALARDRSRMADAEERYATRYVPGETRYLADVRPETIADFVVENTDPARPRLVLDSTP